MSDVKASWHPDNSIQTGCSETDKKNVLMEICKDNLSEHEDIPAEWGLRVDDVLDKPAKAFRKTSPAHTEQRTHKCGLCDQVFVKIADRNTHMDTHMGNKAYQCEQCGFVSLQRTVIQTHMSLHMSKDSPLKCNQISEIIIQKVVVPKKTFPSQNHNNSEQSVHGSSQSQNNSATCHSNNVGPLSEITTIPKSQENIPSLCGTDSNKETSSSTQDLRRPGKVCAGGKPQVLCRSASEVQLMTHTGITRYKCCHCSEQFTQASTLSRHMVIHTGEKPHKCFHCGKLFRTTSELKAHMMTHIEETPYKCSHCGKLFRTTSELKAHMMTHIGEKPHKCSHCGKKYAWPGTLKTHMVIHTGKRPYKCSHCGNQFKRASDLKMHMMTHIGEKPYKCSECGKQFTWSGSLKAHMMTHAEEPHPHRCPVCHAYFAEYVLLSRHITTVCKTKIGYLPNSQGNVNGKTHQPTGGSEEYRINKVSGQHVKTHTGDSKTHVEESSPSSETYCEEGKAKISRAARVEGDSAKSHMAGTDGTLYTNKPHHCSVCPAKFVDESNFKVHMTTHMAVERHSCPFCIAWFPRLQYLKTHIKSHAKQQLIKGISTTEKPSLDPSSNRVSHLEQNDAGPHLCVFCGERFESKSVANEHMLHTAGSCQVPVLYECPHCSRTFARTYNLKRHMKVHTVDQPYKCSVCGKYFMQAGGLKRHMMTHTGEKPRKCSVDCKVDNNLSGVQEHQIVHIGNFENAPCTTSPKDKEFVKVPNRENDPDENSVVDKPGSPMMTGHTGIKSKADFCKCEEPHDFSSCHICVKGFHQPVDLQNHLLMHICSSCVTCVRGYLQVTDLQNHVSNHLVSQVYVNNSSHVCGSCDMCQYKVKSECECEDSE